MRFLLLGCLFATLPLAGVAAESPKQTVPKPSAEAPPPPPMQKQPETRSAPSTEPETGLEPEINIITRGDTTFEEYRINGRHYMTKVTPKNGRPYYLIDKEGSGQFRRSDMEPAISVPNWVIKSW